MKREIIKKQLLSLGWMKAEESVTDSSFYFG
jgi:hypothetical protein